MILVETIAGNVHEPDWQARLAAAEVDLLVLDQWDAQKGRLRRETAGGAEIAISLDRGAHLRDGDVLAWDEAAQRAIVARIDLNEVMVVELDGLDGAGSEALVRTMFELGHALGNQHWPAVIKGGRIFVPLTVDRKVMASVMKTHAFPNVSYDFRSGVEVIPYMTPHEARRLFGGASSPSDPHPHGHGHHHHHHNRHGHMLGHQHKHGHDHEPRHRADSADG